MLSADPVGPGKNALSVIEWTSPKSYLTPNYFNNYSNVYVRNLLLYVTLHRLRKLKG